VGIEGGKGGQRWVCLSRGREQGRGRQECAKLGRARKVEEGKGGAEVGRFKQR
jgi:hypothetical protein